MGASKEADSVRPQIIAHRGARAYAPENTLEAIAMAASTGADAVELDVQMSVDGFLVVVHDDDLRRCSDVCERFPDRRPWGVAQFRRDEIATLDAGTWYVTELSKPVPERQGFLQSLTAREEARWITPRDLARYGSGDVRIPGLGECLRACATLGLELHLELKAIPCFWPNFAEQALREIKSCQATEFVIVSSFDHQQLAKVRALDDSIRTAVLSSDRLHRPSQYVAALGAHAYNPGCYGDFDTIGFRSVLGRIDQETIAEVRSAGLGLNVWTENDPERLAKLVEAGVTGIFTDYPDRLRAILDS